MTAFRLRCWPLKTAARAANNPAHVKHAAYAAHAARHAHRIRHARRAIAWTCVLIGLPAAAIVPPLFLAPSAPPQSAGSAPGTRYAQATLGSGRNYFPPERNAAAQGSPQAIPEPDSASLLLGAVTAAMAAIAAHPTRCPAGLANPQATPDARVMQQQRCQGDDR